MEVEPLLESARHRDAMRRKLGYGPEHVVIGKIARLFHLKGHEYLIERPSDWSRRQPQVRFLLVGDGVLREPLERQIRRGRAGRPFSLRRTGAAGARFPAWSPPWTSWSTPACGKGSPGPCRRP